MPDRILRDEILTSERYWSLSSDTARLLFVHLILRADDLGIFRAANYSVRSTCFGVVAPSAESTAKLLSELNDADLVRLYQIDGVDLGFVPRFRQRLRVMKSRYALPPERLRDSDFKALLSKMSDGSQATVGHASAEGKRREGKRSKSNGQPDGFLEFWNAYPRKVKRKEALKAWQKLAPDEGLRSRIHAALEIHKRSDRWTKDGGSYVPDPTSWLRGARWEDELEAGSQRQRVVD